MEEGGLCIVIVMCMIKRSYKLRKKKRFGNKPTAKTIAKSIRTPTTQTARQYLIDQQQTKQLVVDIWLM